MRSPAIIFLMFLITVFNIPILHAKYMPSQFYTIYVAPNGDDTWSGALPEPNDSGNDGPVATLTRAQEVVRERLALNSGKAPIHVVIRGGSYYLAEPLTFDSRDSGSAECPVAWRAAENERVVVSGGIPVSGWKKTRGGLWHAPVPGNMGAHIPRQLFVNGRRAVRARTPDIGEYNIVKGLVDTDNTASDANKAAFIFNDGEINAGWVTDDMEIIVLHRWDKSRLHVSTVDENTNTVHLTGAARWPFRTDRRFWVENIREALDKPGEWFFDSAGEMIYYMPRPGEDITTSSFIASRLDNILTIGNERVSEPPATHLTFEGITFSHADWDLGREGFPGKQAAFDVPADISVYGAEDCAFIRCEISHMGGHGILIGRGCRRVNVTGCHIHDVGGSGVMIGESYITRPLDFTETCGNKVTDCTIHENGRVYFGAVGIWVGETNGNLIAHNEIFNTPYTAVSAGWCWSFNPNRTRDNIIEYNHLHHLMNNMMSDGGGIYTLGISPGSRLRNNVIHDVDAYSDHSGRGIYLDEGTTGMIVENNVVYRTSGPLMRFQIGTAGNIVVNNIFALGHDAQLGFDTDRTNVFQRNIVYFGEGRLFGRDNWRQYQQVMDWNCYWRKDGRPVVFPGGRTWEEWRNVRPEGRNYFNPQPFDIHSIMADPLFADPERGDFRIPKDSPALEIGFIPIDVSNAGPRPGYTIPDIERP